MVGTAVAAPRRAAVMHEELQRRTRRTGGPVVLRPRTATSLASVAAVTSLLAALLIPARAQASGWPAHPTGIHVTASTGSSFTVAMDRAANALYYRVYASTVHS